MASPLELIFGVSYYFAVFLAKRFLGMLMEEILRTGYLCAGGPAWLVVRLEAHRIIFAVL